MRHTALCAAVLGVVLLWAAPTGADAAYSSCSYDGSTHAVTATLAAGSQGQLAVSSSSISADGSACGGATTLNTETVVLASGSASSCHTIDLGSQFAPGFSDEAGASDEIEFQAAGVGCIVIKGSTGPDHFTAGYTGGTVQVSLNADEASGVDADLVAGSSTAVTFVGGGGNDTLSGGGGVGTGSADAQSLTLAGGTGQDSLTGPATVVSGGPNDDQITVPATGFTSIDYSNASGGVTASLPAGTATGKDGEGGTDTFAASGPFELVGSEFEDKITVVSGTDTIATRGGNDTVMTDNGFANTVSCGSGTDSASGDQLDKLAVDCETRTPAPSSPESPPSTGSAPPGGSPQAGAPTSPKQPVFKRVAVLPSVAAAKSCRQRDRLTIALRGPVDDAIAKVKVAVNGKTAISLRGKRKEVVLEDLPQGRFALKVEITLKSGTKLMGSRSYGACA